MRRPTSVWVVLVLAVLPVAAAAAPNVLVITVDTLRADHLGAYGYELPTSPRLDALAARGVRLDAVTATASETAPATASLLTGLYQPTHRVVANRETLPPHVVTLAEHLRAAGYATAGFVGNDLVGAPYGFAQGFDAFAAFRGAADARADASGVDAAVAWLRDAPRAPWLLWLHLMDPHGPYAPAAEWEARVRYPPGRFGADPPVAVGHGNFGLGMIPRYQAVAGETRLSAYVRRYDGEIAFTDAQIGRLLDWLAAADLDDDTLVVVTADHGESLTEHDEYLQHGWFVYDTTVRLPMIVAWPGRVVAGRTVARSLSGVDLLPTVLEAVGRPAPAVDGQSFLADLTTAAPAAADRVAVAVGARENHPVAVREGRWKLIHSHAAAPPTPVSRQALEPLDLPERWELYDVEADPGETRNRAAVEAARRTALAAHVRAMRRALRMGGHAW